MDNSSTWEIGCQREDRGNLNCILCRIGCQKLNRGVVGKVIEER